MHLHAGIKVSNVDTNLKYFYFLGTPRTTAESYEETLKYGKQIKRESPPIRSFEGGISKGKPYEGVNTIKELGRSIHEIPRQDPSGQDLRKTPELSDRRVMESSLSQVLNGLSRVRFRIYNNYSNLMLCD